MGSQRLSSPKLPVRRCSGSVATAVSFFELGASSIDGEPVSFGDHSGKVILVVNVASKCGYTGQYNGLQMLYDKYQDRGFEVFAFPCNQFGNQEPGTRQEIVQFCNRRYHVTFPLFEKVEVNGPNEPPLYRFLKGATSGEDIKWNFEKFLVGRDGAVIRRYRSNVTPEALKDDIDFALSLEAGNRR